ncbi:hypothetical protein [uncultured Methanoregula sp.]|uniref:hypothetical protein n=1 Tax=uncultured Methanoregula sp. TaxID=1005933 RepID=UPI002AAB01F9|nr:hypothetical protein [uncultured Methanoregula sp.]
MRIRSNQAIAVCGKKERGKTTWIKAHLKPIPPGRLYVLDFNSNDYQDLKPLGVNVWNYEGGGQHECEEFINTCYTMGNVFIVLEEADNYLHSKSPSITRFVTTIRNRGGGHIDNFKRPMSVLPVFRGMYDFIVLFQITAPEDIDYLEKWAGTGKGSLEFIRSLQVGEHVIINLNAKVGENPIGPVQKLNL